jgi:hypothetical protein
VDGNAVTALGKYAFGSGVKSVAISESVTDIDMDAFASCDSLRTVYCERGSAADNALLYPNGVKLVYNGEAVITYGDADSDNILTASDAAYVLQKVLNSQSEMPIESQTQDWMTYVDVDKDNILTASDAAYILQKVLNGNSKMPVETDN